MAGDLFCNAADDPLARCIVPYRETCARQARMFSSDLEGHAPSWPPLVLLIGRTFTTSDGRDRSASLRHRYLVAAPGRFGIGLQPASTAAPQADR